MVKMKTNFLFAVLFFFIGSINMVSATGLDTLFGSYQHSVLSSQQQGDKSTISLVKVIIQDQTVYCLIDGDGMPIFFAAKIPYTKKRTILFSSGSNSACKLDSPSFTQLITTLSDADKLELTDWYSTFYEKSNSINNVAACKTANDFMFHFAIITDDSYLGKRTEFLIANNDMQETWDLFSKGVALSLALKNKDSDQVALLNNDPAVQKYFADLEYVAPRVNKILNRQQD